MPIYSYECCEQYLELYQPLTSSEVPRCEKCGVEMEKVWPRSSRHIPASGFPFVTKHFNGQPITVTSESHLQSLCKQFNVTHRPDAAFLEKEYLGWDPKTKQHKWREGSGVGLPGCWL